MTKKGVLPQARIPPLAVALWALLVFSFLLFLYSHHLVERHHHHYLYRPSDLVGIHSPKSKTQVRRHEDGAKVPTSPTSNPNNDGYSFHYVFSSGCNALQDWQSYMFFYSMKAIGFDGNVTRVASCETEEDASILRSLHNQQIKIMSPRFNLHTTPDYTHLVPGPKYNFFNKPFGIRHFLEHGLELPSRPDLHKRTIIVVLDPDQFLLRLFVRNMTTEDEIWSNQPDHAFKVVDEGQPMAAGYAFGGSWISKINTEELLNATAAATNKSTNTSKPRSGLTQSTVWNAKHMDKYYAVGPPYVAVASDMYRIATTWTDFVVPIYKQMKAKNIDPFMAEMYGYSSAAAHLNLPHRISTSFMISNIDTSGEGVWPAWIDKRSSEEVCDLEMHPTAHAIHLCQRYFIGNYFISKYQVPKTPPDDLFFSCEHPLLKEPPADVARKYDWALSLDGMHHKLSEKQRIRTAFIVCQMFPRLNAAATYFKDQHCQPGEGNYSKVFVFETHPVKKERLARERAARAQLAKK